MPFQEKNHLFGMLSAAQPTNQLRGMLSPSLRNPYPGELDYFKKNPSVAGMAAEDDNIILNPFSGLSPEAQKSVYKNELARIMMRNGGVNPSFGLTPQQTQMFQGTAYESNPNEAKQSILARILSGDSSAGQSTPEQSGYANFLRELWGWK